MKKILAVMVLMCMVLFPAASNADSFRDSGYEISFPDNYKLTEADDEFGAMYGFMTENTASLNDGDYQIHIFYYLSGAIKENEDDQSRYDLEKFYKDHGMNAITRCITSLSGEYERYTDEAIYLEGDGRTVIREKHVADNGSERYAYLVKTGRHGCVVFLAGYRDSDKKCVPAEKQVSETDDIVMSFEDTGHMEMLFEENEADLTGKAEKNSFSFEEFFDEDFLFTIATIVLSAILSLIMARRKKKPGEDFTGMVTDLNQEDVEKHKEVKGKEDKTDETVKTDCFDEERYMRMMKEGLITKKEYRELKKKSR